VPKKKRGSINNDFLKREWGRKRMESGNNEGGEAIVTIDDLIEELSPIKEEYLIEDEEIVAGLWHDLIELSPNKRNPPAEEEWIKAVTEWVRRNNKTIPINEAKRQFNRYFSERFGIEPFTQCPMCGRGITRPRVNAYNQYFVGCSDYPLCKYISTRDDRDKMIRELNKLKDEILDKAEEKMKEVNKLLMLAKKIKEYNYTYDEIREIKREWYKYE
jgi:hypothetical protein